MNLNFLEASPKLDKKYLSSSSIVIYEEKLRALDSIIFFDLQWDFGMKLKKMSKLFERKGRREWRNFCLFEILDLNEIFKKWHEKFCDNLLHEKI